MKNCWIIGASSGIGSQLAKKYYEAGWNVIISARRIDKLKELQLEIISNKNLENKIETMSFDVCCFNDFMNISTLVFDKYYNIDLVVFAPAIYKPMNIENFNLKFAQEIINVNLISALNFIELVIKKMLQQKTGQIAVISSVAGYRGLPNSMAYGASKAALTNLFEGIYPELKANNLSLSIINPGFVATELTAQNNFKMPFLISANEASDYIYQGLEHKDFEIHFPKKFTFIMKFLRILPIKIYLKIITYIYKKQ